MAMCHFIYILDRIWAGKKVSCIGNYFQREWVNFLNVFYLCVNIKRRHKECQLWQQSCQMTVAKQQQQSKFCVYWHRKWCGRCLSWLSSFYPQLTIFYVFSTRMKKIVRNKKTVWVEHKCRKAFRLICKIPRCFNIENTRKFGHWIRLHILSF